MNCSNRKRTKYNEPFISNRADPFVYRHSNGKVYFTASVPEYDRIILRCADCLDALAKAEEITIWKKHEQGPMSIHIWAPEIHCIKGIWYIFYAGGDKDDIWAIRPYMLRCKDSDPLNGTWEELGQMQALDDYTFQDFSLDMTVFEHHSQLYCVWAEKVSVGKKISNLYIAQLDPENPNQLKSEQTLLTAPDYDWERVGFWVNEGPSILKHHNRIFLTYSASETGASYCIGMLSVDDSADLSDPKQWLKERMPVLSTDAPKGLYGPGHNCFVKSEDGQEDVMFYHARQYDEILGDPLYDFNRHTYRMKVKWENDIRPVLDFENNF